MMLNQELVLKGPSTDHTIPKNWSLGEHFIECQRKRNYDSVLCIDGITNEILTSGQFVEDALKLAHALRGLGVQSGDVVAVVSENNVKFATILAAVLYIGAVLNPLNPIYKTGELKHALSLSKPKVVFCTKTSYENVKQTVTKLKFIEHLLVIGSKDVIDVDTLDALLETTVVNVDNVEPAGIITSEHTAMILLSSGTTGLPKGVMITHENCHVPIICQIGKPYVDIQQSDVSVGVLPFFHIFGMSAVIYALVYSAKLIILPSFQSAIFLNCIQNHKVSLIYTVPPIIGFLAKHPLVSKYDLTSIRMTFCAGGSLGHKIREELCTRHPNIKTVIIYGSTETTGACTFATKNDLLKLESVGPVAPGVEAMVWNADLGINVEAHKIGELCFRGRSIMKGYIGRENSDIDQYGFYHTGDIGYYDEDGWFYMVGRIKELIKYKGFQVPPAELEDLLLKHPAVKDCAVFGIPDDKAGQLPAALVVNQEGADVTETDIVDYVAEKISAQKHLYGGVKFVDGIPRNAAGKILRQKLIGLYNTI